MPAAGALEELAGMQSTEALVPAREADKAFRPRRLEQCLSALLFGAVVAKKVGKTADLLKLNCIA